MSTTVTGKSVKLLGSKGKTYPTTIVLNCHKDGVFRMLDATPNKLEGGKTLLPTLLTNCAIWQGGPWRKHDLKHSVLYHGATVKVVIAC
jgi:hypothetical protein